MGSKLATIILQSPYLFDQWLGDLKNMSLRIKGMRKALFDELIKLGTPGNWEHIVSQVSFRIFARDKSNDSQTFQVGMFSYTGLTETKVASIQKDHHVYMLTSGRISVAGCRCLRIL